MKIKAFTLAEVLITLGIIGIVASMTLPAIIQTNKNIEVESRLKKVYSVMNQAILLSEIDNGPKEYWPPNCSGEANCRQYFERYILKYLKNISTVEFSSYGGYNVAIYFGDGSVLVSKSGYDYFFFPNGKNFDKDNFVNVSDDGNVDSREGQGITYFPFRFSPSEKNTIFHYKKGFEPYKWGLSVLTEQALRNAGSYGCNKNSKLKSYCTALIQLNGWKIPKDYPFKVR